MFGSLLESHDVARIVRALENQTWLRIAIALLVLSHIYGMYWLKLTQDILYQELERRDRTEKDHRLWMENVFDLIMEDPKRSDSTRAKWEEMKK